MAGYKWLEIPTIYANIVKDKKQSANSYYRYFLARVSRMFQYKNLPDTIPHEMLDRYLMNNGIACITKVKDKLYVFYGNLGGPQDVYYRPTEFIISNPHIKTESGEHFTANIPISQLSDSPVDVGQPTEQQGVLIRNDTEWIGLAPMLSRYSYLMAENILTLRTADVMLRITSLLTAPSDKERAACFEYLKSLEKGELGVIGESPFFDGVKLQSPPSNNGSYLTQFIEYQQYLKGSFYNEIGLSANYNMKREAIGRGESTLDEDALLPLCDNMLLCRKEDMERVNNLYDTDISVEFSSAWLENLIETKSQLINMGQPTNPSTFGATEPTDPSVGQPVGESEAVEEIGAIEETEPEKESVIDETEGTGGDEDTDGDGGISDSSESEINDIAQDSFLNEMNDQLDEKLEELPNEETMGQPIEEGGSDESTADEESSENKETVSGD